MEVTKRFSIRHGMEAEPTEPIFEEAPKRLRFFIFDVLRHRVHRHEALKVVARAFCKPELIVAYPAEEILWLTIKRCIDDCKGWELYNLIEEMHPAMRWNESHLRFQGDLNRVFGEESIGWNLDQTGRLQRLLPAIVQPQVEQVFMELQAPRFSPALIQVTSAHKAYNARPRRDFDVCSNIFNALESVAKEVFSVSGTFGDVLKLQRVKDTFSSLTISTLEKVYAMANGHFRHGMTEPFKLTPAETDFVYVTCIGGMMLFVRSVPRS